jgi:hypothetical protein
VFESTVVAVPLDSQEVFHSMQLVIEPVVVSVFEGTVVAVMFLSEKART